MNKLNLIKVKIRLKRMGMKAVPPSLAIKIAGLSEKIGLAKAIKTSMKSATRCTAIYNDACVVCKNKLLNDPDMLLQDYCPTCRKVVEKHMGDMTK